MLTTRTISRAALACVAALGVATYGCGEAVDSADPPDQQVHVGEQDVLSDGVALDAGACPVDGALCDDLDPCTVSDHCKNGVCVAGPDICDCRADDHCPKGDLCLGPPVCDTSKVPYRCGRALGSAVDCGLDAFGSCTRARCDPVTGACKPISRPNGALCFNGGCGAVSTCAEGTCTDGSSACVCKVDADCPKNEDLCMGERYCDTSAFPHECRVNKITVTVCGAGKAPCLPDACDPKTGKCAATPVELTVEVCVEGAGCVLEKAAAPAGGGAKGKALLCDDGDTCTQQTLCAGGACAGGTNVCDCTTSADCASQDDGDYCNGTLFCELKTNTCQLNPSTVVTCSTEGDTGCVKTSCDKPTGLCTAKSLKNGTPCDDAKPCTADDVCAAGACVGTVNVCKCTKHTDCKDNDNNACNGGGWCNTGIGYCLANPSTAVFCPSAGDTTCAKNACVPLSGDCTQTAVERTTQICPTAGVCRREVLPAAAPPTGVFACSDGDPCTTGDLCGANVCNAGKSTCSCQSDGDCTDDGDLCNGVPFCDKTDPAKPVCKANLATKITCPTAGNTTCLTHGCDAQTGKCVGKPAVTGTSCDDKNPCTQSDSCLLGQCVGVNTCECQFDSDCKAKEDGNQCNGTLFCDKSTPDKPTCALNPASVVKCPSTAPVCLGWSCVTATGQCVLGPAAVGVDGAVSPCSDGDPCTDLDACSAGVCGGKPKGCDDNNACTADSCVAGTCVHKSKVCDDGKACTADGCDPKTGACTTNALVNNGKGCDSDNSGCTVNDVCLDGVCKAGAAVSCPPIKTTLPCRDTVCSSTGATSFQCVLTTAKDGALCDDGDACTGDGACKGGVCGLSDDALLHSQLVLLPEAAKFDRHNTGHAMYIDAQDNAVVAGRYIDKDAKGWWLAQVATTGKVSQGCTVSVDATAATALPVGVFASANGRSILVGSTGSSTLGLSVSTMRVSSACKIESAVAIGAASAGERLEKAVAVSTTGFVAVGERVEKAGSRGYVARLSAAGQLIWSWVDGGYSPAVKDAVVNVDGSLILVGSVFDPGGAGKRLPRVLRLDASGKKTADSVQKAFGDAALTAVAARPAGGFVAVGTRIDDGKSRLWWARLNADGVVTRERAGALGIAPTGISAATPGWYVTGTASPTGSDLGFWLARTDDVGNLRWEQAPPGTGLSEGAALIAWKGGVWAVGSARAGNQQGAHVVRADSWGHATCGESGICAGKVWQDCDDGVACTTDTCAAKSGCQHAKNSGWACEDGAACSVSASCIFGSCSGSINGTLHTKKVDVPGLAAFVGAARVGQSAGALAGYSGGQITNYSVDPFGTLAAPVALGSATQGDAAIASGQGAVTLADGSIVVAYRMVNKAVRVAGFDASGKQLWSKQVCTPNTYSAASHVKCNAGTVATASIADCQGQLIALADGTSAAWVGGSSYVGTGCWTGTGAYCPLVTGRLWTLKFVGKTGAIVGTTTFRRNGWWLPPTGVATVLCKTKGVLFSGGDHYISTPTAVATAAGGLVMVGQARVYASPTKAATLGAVVEWHTANMNLLWRHVAFVSGATPTFRAAVENAGHVIAAGESVQAGTGVASLLVLETDGAGKELWRSVLSRAGLWQVHTVDHRPDGYVVGGVGQHQGLQKFWLERRDRSGALLWSRQHGFEANLIAGDLWPNAAGGFQGLGVLVKGGVQSVAVLRTDRFGYGDCKSTGACFGKTESDCDDKKPCTADYCDGAAGSCKHVASSGASCVGGTCIEGVCTKP